MQILRHLSLRYSRRLVLLLVVAGFAAFASRPAQAVSGFEGTFEYAFDAPWRMEPSTGDDGQLEYGAIPIQLTIHDAMFSRFDDDPKGVPVSFGKFLRAIVREPGHSIDPGHARKYSLSDLEEIEMTKGYWSWPSGARPPEHAVYRKSSGDDPMPFADISQTSEWHALIWYEPKSKPEPGTWLHLEIEVRVGKPLSPIVLRNHVRVYFGDAPLPRFDQRWLYGDLHYHAQGTDNEGESAYNYRGVVRAMGAMGLDFVFATEHASDSEQIVDVDLDIKVDVDHLKFGYDVELHKRESRGGVLRDMSRERFDFNHGLLWGKNGVNRDAAFDGWRDRPPQGILSHGVVPQIFLGGELDVIPESRTKANIPYGNELIYRTDELLGGWLKDVRIHDKERLMTDLPFRFHFQHLLFSGQFQLNSGKPDRNELWEKRGDTFLIRDVQGLNEYFYGREHLVYFPKSSRRTVSVSTGEFTFEDTAFVSSSTGLYGGAQRRLAAAHSGKRAMLPEIEAKGFAFIAHHLNAPSGSPGPDGPPWSAHMLETAWRSPGILGLQFWNQEERISLP